MAAHLSHKVYSFRYWLASGLMLVSLTGLAACAPEPAETDVVNGTEMDDVEAVAEDPDELLGQRVTLRGSFVEQLEPETFFKLREDTLFPDDSVLIVNATGTDYFVPEDESIDMWVVGTVEQFDSTTIAEQYNLELDPALYADYEGQPVVIAEYIALAPEPEEISENPDVFYGQQVVVGGEVETVFAPDAFTLENEQLLDDKGLLVVGAVPELAKEEGPVSVSGTLLPFSTEDLEKEHDLLWDPEIQQTLETEYSGRPAIIAQEVYPFSE